jgi:short-subunit dehydrogenase
MRKNQTALVTGASYGIGLEFARIFAREGFDLVLVARSSEKLEEIAAEVRKVYGSQVRNIVKDLSAPGAAHELFQEVQRAGLAVDVLVNNAGVGTHGFFLETSRDKELAMLRLNIEALTDLCKLFLPAMARKKSGKILNVASTAAFQPGPLMAVYYASKAYVLSFSEALSHELAGTGVTVTCLCPGPTRSEFQKTAGIGHVKLFTYAAMKAAPVAEAGYRGLMRGKRLVIPGLLNKIMAFSVRLTPRWLVPAIVRYLQEERRKHRQETAV